MCAHPVSAYAEDIEFDTQIHIHHLVQMGF